MSDNGTVPKEILELLAVHNKLKPILEANGFRLIQVGRTDGEPIKLYVEEVK